MTIDEAIIHAREVAKEQKLRSGICTTNGNECDKFSNCLKCAEEHSQLAEWLEELKELRAYKEKMEMQHLDDIRNPLEPIKLSSALKSEIMKYEFRKKNDPKQISPLDYTIMYALKHCLEEMTEVKMMEDNKYLKMPWSIEDTIENMKVLKKSLQEKAIEINLDGKGDQDAKEVEFDFDRAIEALDKQIPKKSKTKILCRDIEWWCPNCGESHVMMDSKKGFKYCHHCGQKLDWSEEE